MSMSCRVVDLVFPANHRAGKAPRAPRVKVGVAGPMTKEEQEAFVRDNQGLVRLVARRYRGRGLDFEDLCQLGNLGLMAAAERFDPARGKPSTFATPLVFRAILEGVRDTARAIRVPAHADVSMSAYKRTRRQLPDGATEEDVFEAMGLPPGRRRPVRDALRAKVGADNSELDRLTVEPLDALAGLILEEQREQLGRALALLPPELAAVIARRFGLGGHAPMNIGATAADLAISHRTAKRREAEGLRELRRLLNPSGGDDG